MGLPPIVASPTLDRAALAQTAGVRPPCAHRDKAARRSAGLSLLLRFSALLLHIGAGRRVVS